MRMTLICAVIVHDKYTVAHRLKSLINVIAIDRSNISFQQTIQKPHTTICAVTEP